ncbi:MAG: hypothetical protein KVP17_003552 [Porospora cf. gigantea B]|uniref:uncharacterized protein n=1 Tax=Porospora cf. gigantea B TaxID=2853592 RepID=UPI003571AED3|nr:MAG: hypothetical protein KVP17_003552 [Porospora cf. gigantea B]
MVQTKFYDDLVELIKSGRSTGGGRLHLQLLRDPVLEAGASVEDRRYEALRCSRELARFDKLGFNSGTQYFRNRFDVLTTSTGIKIVEFDPQSHGDTITPESASDGQVPNEPKYGGTQASGNASNDRQEESVLAHAQN